MLHLFCCIANNNNNNNNNRLTALFWDNPKKHSAFCLIIGLCCVQAGFPHLLSSGFLWIMEAEVPTVRVGATPTGLTAPPPPQPPKVFYRPDALPAAQPTATKH